MVHKQSILESWPLNKQNLETQGHNGSREPLCHKLCHVTKRNGRFWARMTQKWQRKLVRGGGGEGKGWGWQVGRKAVALYGKWKQYIFFSSHEIWNSSKDCSVDQVWNLLASLFKSSPHSFSVWEFPFLPLLQAQQTRQPWPKGWKSE